jgi:hypothetical protein
MPEENAPNENRPNIIPHPAMDRFRDRPGLLCPRICVDRSFHAFKRGMGREPPRFPIENPSCDAGPGRTPSLRFHVARQTQATTNFVAKILQPKSAFCMQGTVTERKKSRKQGVSPLAALGELDRTDSTLPVPLLFHSITTFSGTTVTPAYP